MSSCWIEVLPEFAHSCVVAGAVFLDGGSSRCRARVCLAVPYDVFVEDGDVAAGQAPRPGSR